MQFFPPPLNDQKSPYTYIQYISVYENIFIIIDDQGDHEYRIYEPTVDTPERWSYWDLICKVIWLSETSISLGEGAKLNKKLNMFRFGRKWFF